MSTPSVYFNIQLSVVKYYCKGCPEMEELNFIEIGARIRAGREELGLTHEQLAEQLEVSAKFCSDIELGLRGISVKTHRHKRVEPTRPKSFIFHILGRFSPCNTDSIDASKKHPII